MTNCNIEESVQKYLDEVLFTETIEESFAGYLVESKDKEKLELQHYRDELRLLLSKFNPESLITALRYYVNVTAQLCNDRQINTLFGLLDNAVTENLLQAKLVCEVVLSCPHLRFENQVFWTASFTLIHKIIRSADYKGVRDQLKIMLDKVHTIPSSTNISSLAQLNRLYNVFELIFDRNASLLPAYLVLDEIQKKMYPKGRWPHWKFAKLLSDFVDSFHPTAQMVSIVGQSKLLPVVGHSSTLGNAWELDPLTAKFQLRGQLPYRKELQQPQTELLRYVIEQPYSRDMVCSMLNLTTKAKQRSPILEQQIIELILTAMDRSESESDSGALNEHVSNPTLFLWQHLSSLVIYFVLFHYASFPHMVTDLHTRLLSKNYKNGRENLMWVLLQFISGAIQKNPLNDFLPILKLYDILYPETEPLPVPDITKPGCTHALAAASIWIHLMRKAESEPCKLHRPLPPSLSLHFEFLQQKMSSTEQFVSEDYRNSLICNAYSTTQDCFARPMTLLVESIQKAPTNDSTSSPSKQQTPLSMDLLDSLTVHAKMSLIHSIVANIMKMSQSKGTAHPSSALIETYSRLLIYTEIESLGIKGFMTQLLNQVFRCNSWPILHTLLEMFTYRLHHVPAHYRVQLLGSLHNISTIHQTNQVQLHLCMESTALKLILGLSSAEVLAIPQFPRVSDPKTLISNESEELNKVLVLTVARAIHVTGAESLTAAGSWCTELLSSIMHATPVQWSSFTLKCFPPVIAKCFHNTPAANQESVKEQLKKSVEEEYKKWKAMSNDNDKISHFSNERSSNLFLCLLWKIVLESEDVNNSIPSVAYIILERLGPRVLSVHLRYFADFLVNELAYSYGGNHLKKYVDALNDLIWKCNVISLDRLILCMSLRAFEGINSQVCLLICVLLLDTPEFKSRVEAFVSENSPEHWKQSDWNSKHNAFHQRFPEKLFFENLEVSNSNKYYPVYYSNVCLRFLPVIDVVIHRFIELPNAPMPKHYSIETLLDRIGCLYKFHEKPITYLYNTLHFYENHLKDRSSLKKKLVASIIGAFKDVKPKDWALTSEYTNYMNQTDDSSWNPSLDYYISLMSRLVDTLNGQTAFHTDWRFSEFPNPPAHALHVICIELMALPVAATSVANHLLDVCLVGHKIIPRSNIASWMNAVGLVLTALPDSYWCVLLDRVVDMMTNSPLAIMGSIENPIDVMDFEGSHSSMSDVQIGYMIALTHAVWHHASVGQVNTLPTFLKERVKPRMETEEQFLFVCHLVCPFLQRFYTERTRIVMDVTIELYEFLGIIDKSCHELRFMDSICDLLYHIKYMFTGDSVKSEIESIIRHLRPQLQLRLRFITHLTIDEVLSSSNNDTTETEAVKHEPMFTN